MNSALRASDVAARLGGDEFAVLLLNAPQDDAVAIAERILNALAAPYLMNGHALDIRGSIGLAIAPDHGADPATLLRRADVAMYVAKRGKLGYAVYDAEQDPHSATRLTFESDLRKAIAHADFELHYQPKVDLSSEEVDHVEALLRWPHPSLGLLPPDQFIPLAEETGLILPLTRWALEAAIAQLQAWEHEGLALGVAVNLSMRTLQDPLLPETIGALLHRYTVAPERLTLEVTESVVMADRAQTQDVFARLAALGVRLSIDDFGTGYSSLGYLKQLPVGELKIDKSFVLGMADADSKDAEIVRLINDLGHNLGLRVVAEGVETPEVWNMLAGLGCDVMQGYYVSRPLPAAELAHWLRAASWRTGAAPSPV